MRADAGQVPARLHLPASRQIVTCSSVHVDSNRLFRHHVGHQDHQRDCNRLPRHGTLCLSVRPSVCVGGCVCACLVIIWVIKTIKQTSIVFPAIVCNTLSSTALWFNKFHPLLVCAIIFVDRRPILIISG